MAQSPASTLTGSEAGPRVFTSDFLSGGAPEGGLAVVVLNWQLPSITPHLLQKAAIRICADGGANRLHDEVPSMFPGQPADEVRTRFLPQIIKGDLDSIREDVLEFYRSRGVKIVDLSADQDTTDLHKCLAYVQRLAAAAQSSQRPTATSAATPQAADAAGAVEQESGERPSMTVVAVGAHGGRLDHILSNLSTLHVFRDMHVVLCGDGNLTRLLPAGRSIIRPHKALEGPSCGLVPLLGPATASSQGLRWNLDHTHMRIGGLVSTSNLIQGGEVAVDSDSDLVWTTQLREEQ